LAEPPMLDNTEQFRDRAVDDVRADYDDSREWGEDKEERREDYAPAGAGQPNQGSR
jgi:hypothetical protein